MAPETNYLWLAGVQLVGTASDPMHAKVKATMELYQMVAAGDRIVVAVSGGLDSVVLLHVLLALAPESGLALQVGHINHGLRPEAADDANFVSRLARAYNLPFSIAHIDVPAAMQAGDSVQHVARQLRYQALWEQGRRAGAQRLAVAHHRDDHIETVLMRLLTGTGVDGLAGIAPVRGVVIRPLIQLSRAEIEAYARRQGLQWREDESNMQTNYLRNRIRLELLPHLQRHYNPRVKEALLRLSEIAREEAGWAADMVTRLEGEVRVDKPLFTAMPLTTFSVSALRQAPVVLQKRLVRRALWRGGAHRPTAAAVELARSLLAPAGPGKPAAHDLPGGVRVRLHRQQLYVYDKKLDNGMRFESTLPVPGRCRATFAGIVLQAERAQTTKDAVTKPAEERGGGAVSWQACCQLPTLSSGARVKLTVRNIRPGDRLTLTSGRKIPLLEFFRQQAVPLPLRPHLPVVCHREEVVAVPGYYPPAKKKPAAATGRAVHLFAWPDKPFDFEFGP